VTLSEAASEGLSRRLAYLDNLVPALAAAESSAAVAAVSLRGAAEFFHARGALLAEVTADGGLDLAAASIVPPDLRSAAERAGLMSKAALARVRQGQLRSRSPVGPLVTAPLMIRNDLLGVLILGYADDAGCAQSDLEFLPTVAAQCALSLVRTRLYEAEHAARERLGFLVDAGTALAGSLELEETLDRLAGLVVPHLADWCAIHVEENGRLRQMALRHRDPGAVGAVASMLSQLPLNRSAPYGAGAVLAAGRSQALPSFRDDIKVGLAAGNVTVLGALRRLPLGAGLIVPLSVPGRTLGAITLIREAGPPYADVDVEVAEELGKRAGLAVDSALAHRLVQQAFRERDAAADVADLERERLTGLLEQLPVGVVLAEARSGRIRLSNRATERIWGEPFELGQVEEYAERLSTRPDGSVMAPEDWPLVQAIRDGVESRGERVAFTRADGSRCFLEISAGPVRDRIGDVVAGVAVFSDVSDRVAAEQALAASEQRANALAHTLQESLLPPALPEVPGLELAAAYRPVGQGVEVGGDFYDVTGTAREDEWAVVIGDVCGKGAPAAAVTALARHTIRAAGLRARRPSVILRQLNEVMIRHATERPFLTAVYASLRRMDDDAQPYRLTLAVGGHPLPMLLRADGKVGTVGQPGSLIGILEEAEFTDEVVPLAHGDVLLLFTDGLTEARAGVEFFGDTRLRDALSRCAGGSAADVVAGVLAAVDKFSAGRQRDDVALFALRVR
jgi:sigma-B regulation protein RsbU (phosphoserine phosphatase)